MATNKVRLNLNKDTGKVTLEKVALPPKQNVTKFTGKIEINEEKVKLVSNKYKNLDDSIDIFIKTILTAGLTQNNQTKIINCLKGVVCGLTEVSLKLFESCEIKEKPIVLNIVNSIQENFKNKIGKFETTFKLKQVLRKNQFFVEPIEKSIGTKWKTKRNIDCDLPDHKIVHSTFEYVPIKKTIESLFMQKNFTDVYFKYNNVEKHQCVENEYKDFCCTEIYKNCDIQQRSEYNTITISCR